jgi:hypothetical protein
VTVRYRLTLTAQENIEAICAFIADDIVLLTHLKGSEWIHAYR